jgi:hypothetical protein
MQGFWAVLVDTNEPCNKNGVQTNTWVAPKDLDQLARVCTNDRQCHILTVKYECQTRVSREIPGNRKCNTLMRVPRGLK